MIKKFYLSLVMTSSYYLSEISELSEDYIAEMPVKLGLIPIYFGSSGPNCF